MTTLMLAIAAAGLLAWGAAVLAGWNAPPRPVNRFTMRETGLPLPRQPGGRMVTPLASKRSENVRMSTIAPSRWRGHP